MSNNNLESQDIWSTGGGNADANAATAEGQQEQDLPAEVLEMTDEQIRTRIRVMDNNLRYMDQEKQRLQHDVQRQQQMVEENKKKIKLNADLPYLVANMVEVGDHHHLFVYAE